MASARHSNQSLLGLRLCDLPELKAGVAGGPLKAYVEGLHQELAAAGCRYFRPEVYFGDEWFSPDGVPKIAVPFYLAHPRLARLEKAMMHSVEGGTPKTLRQLLRHEAGHSFDHAYKLFRGPIGRTAAWRQLFGASPRRYRPEVFAPNVASRDFVRHLPGCYAQAHPEEDFAETFAVAITPGLDWESRYAGWPTALAKLRYVSTLIRTLGRTQPRVADGPACYVATRMRRTLASHYALRKDADAAHRAAVNRLTARARLSNSVSAP